MVKGIMRLLMFGRNNCYGYDNDGDFEKDREGFNPVYMMADSGLEALKTR